MEKSDKMIMLMTLYNRIKDQPGVSEVQADSLFKGRVNRLEMDGHISSEDARFALAYLFRNVRLQEIDKIRNQVAAEERAKIRHELAVNAGYSKSAEVGKINSIIDSVMKEDDSRTAVKTYEFSRHHDVSPC